MADLRPGEADFQEFWRGMLKADADLIKNLRAGVWYELFFEVYQQGARDLARFIDDKYPEADIGRDKDVIRRLSLKPDPPRPAAPDPLQEGAPLTLEEVGLSPEKARKIREIIQTQPWEVITAGDNVEISTEYDGKTFGLIFTPHTANEQDIENGIELVQRRIALDILALMEAPK